MQERNFISVRIQPVKGSRAKHQYLHDMRKVIPKYADPHFKEERATVLFRADGDPEKWRAEQEQEYFSRLRPVGRKLSDGERNLGHVRLRKDTPWGISGIITFGQDVNPDPRDLAKFDQKAKELVRRIAERWGVKARYLVRHNDESHVHYHFFLDYVQKGGERTIRDEINPFHGGRRELREIQDLAGEVFSPLGLRRGVRKEEKLAYLDALKRFGIEKSLLRQIRTSLLCERGLSDLHREMEEDAHAGTYVQYCVDEIREALREGCLPEREHVIRVSEEIARRNPQEARKFLENYQALVRINETLEKELSDLSSDSVWEYFSQLETSLREGRPADPPPTKDGKLWKRLATYVNRYNRALQAGEEIGKRTQRIEKTIQKLKAELKAGEREALSLSDRKKELESGVQALRKQLELLEERGRSFQQDLKKEEEIGELVERLHDKHRGLLGTDWDGFKRDIVALVKSAFREKEKAEEKALRGQQMAEHWSTYAGRLEERIKVLEEELRDLRSAFRSVWNDPQALARRLRKLKRDGGRESGTEEREAPGLKRGPSF